MKIESTNIVPPLPISIRKNYQRIAPWIKALEDSPEINDNNNNNDNKMDRSGKSKKKPKRIFNDSIIIAILSTHQHSLRSKRKPKQVRNHRPQVRFHRQPSIVNSLWLWRNDKCKRLYP